MLNVIIMASGLSKRMGKNKLLLDFKGIPIIEHVLKEVKKLEFNEVIVVSQYDEILNLSNKYGFKSIYNSNSEIGQSESIKLGILNSSKCEGYMFFVGDQPFLENFYINKIIHEFNKDKEYIVIPRFKHKRGNPVIFPSEKKDDLLRLKNDEKGKKIINNYSKIKYIDVSEKMLIDIDDKLDYEKYREV